ncbi:MAG: MtnX-like HAD-IB family phosphatase [Promethearchaeati archaeon SRVP18_Atabeyarchaeia-1]
MCDFDGTITEDDVAQLIFDRFGSHIWWDIENRFRRGEISCKNALIGEFSTVRASRQEIENFVKSNVLMNSDFSRFVESCRTKNVPLAVVSDGLDFYIDLVLREVNLDGVEIYCNKAVFEDNKVRINFPYVNPRCDKCGNCKTQHLKKLKSKGYFVMYVGDGYSDMCVAKEADFIIAKSHLLDFCRANKIACAPFREFGEVPELVDKRIKELNKSQPNNVAQAKSG